MSTKENLIAAFSGESQASRRYLAFSKKAHEDGMPQIAKLFRAAAEAETVHSHNHLRVLQEVKSTKENILAAVKGEKYEYTEMYPKFIEEASKEGLSEAERTFSWANEVEKIHESHLNEALKAIESGNDLEDNAINVCPVCGNTFIGQVPDSCPLCKTQKDMFMEII